MIYIIEMIDDLNEVEQDVLEEIDPDLVSYLIKCTHLASLT
jgi:hypothetical protein